MDANTANVLITLIGALVFVVMMWFMWKDN